MAACAKEVGDATEGCGRECTEISIAETGAPGPFECSICLDLLIEPVVGKPLYS